MEQAYFLIPGLLLSKEVVASLPPEVLDQLTALTSGISEPSVRQTLARGASLKSPHYVWLWSVLTRKPLPFSTAPYRWLLMQGPMLGGEIWRMRFTKMKDSRYQGSVELTDGQIETVLSAVERPLAQNGFTIQRWDRSLFLTRKTPWNIACREFETLYGEKEDFEAAIDTLDDPGNRQEAVDLLTRLNEIIKNLNIDSADRLWIDGGGYARDFYPPTRMRSVLSDDKATLGWAQAAGILNHRTGKLTGATAWPSEAPVGASLALMDGLYEAWLKKDWTTWMTHLSLIARQLEILKKAARLRGCSEALVIGFGVRESVTFKIKLTNPKSIFARLAPNKTQSAIEWCWEAS